VRFDDSLKTVLAADATTAFGARVAFRQIVDLAMRGRVAPDDTILDRLRSLRDDVPVETRSAAARGLALATPPVALIALFVDDVPDVAAAALRAARLDAADWTALLPQIGPAGRAILRQRGDLDAEVVRALESFGSTDFAIGFDAPAVAPSVAQPIIPPRLVDQPPAPPIGESPFVSLSAVARTLPFVAEARRQANEAPPQRFEIAELVDRIEAFQRERETGARPARPAPPTDAFRFETDVEGTIRWLDASPRGAVIGLSLAHGTAGSAAQFDGVAAGAFRHRTAFIDARLGIAGTSALAGDWRVSGVPVFDSATGRFTGFRGTARRPRIDETAAGRRGRGSGASEGLRRLVHELRTPTNAIAGFSELIESEMLGPVGKVYRDRARAIRSSTADLITAIEDLDLAARIEGDALELRPAQVPLAPLLTRIVGDLTPLAELRGCAIDLSAADAELTIACDDIAVERLLGRLLAVLVSAGSDGERIAVATRAQRDDMVEILLDRPHSLAAVPDSALLSLDAEREADMPGAPLLGTGFALRLARNLAAELGGTLSIGARRLTLRLPAGLIADMGQSKTI